MKSTVITAVSLKSSMEKSAMRSAVVKMKLCASSFLQNASSSLSFWKRIRSNPPRSAKRPFGGSLSL